MQKLDREQILFLCRTNPEVAADLILHLFEKIEELEKRIKQLEDQSAQNSRNRSTPPSGDGLKKQTKSLRKKSGRSVGGFAAGSIWIAYKGARRLFDGSSTYTVQSGGRAFSGFLRR